MAWVSTLLSSTTLRRSGAPAGGRKAPALDGPPRLPQHFRDLVVVHHLAFGALVAFEQGCNHFRLQLIRRELAAVPTDAFHLPRRDSNHRRLGAVIRTRPRLHLDGISRQAVGAHGRFAAPIVIPGMAQFGDNGFEFDFSAYRDGGRGRIDFGRVGEYRPRESAGYGEDALDE